MLHRGEKVKLKNNLKVGEIYGGTPFLKGMECDKEKIGIIDYGFIDKNWLKGYFTDFSEYAFTEQMLERVEE